MLYKKTFMSPVGEITLACDDLGKSLTGLWFDRQKYHGGGAGVESEESARLPVFDSAVRWLERYFAGKNPSADELSLSPVGSDFRRLVWEILCEIPYGEVLTYGEIARIAASRMGRQSMSSQAVGGAVGHNPISIIIPCHRVVGVSGSLTGYAGGISRKIKLLELEGVDTSRFFTPTRGTAL